MPVSIVVGGQYGSEGKGKVTHWLARKQQARYAIRVGGPNSGHTVVDKGRRTVFRTLPTPTLIDGVIGVVPAGAYLDVDVLLREVEKTGLTKDRLLIHPSAVVIDDSMKEDERQASLVEAIGSTGQGVGGAVAQRAMRRRSVTFAEDVESLRGCVRADLDRILADALDRGERIIVEGTQGFGLSILHGEDYPYVTSRDTTAAGALSEAGLSPRDVDCVALTLRAFPIRVGGHYYSGSLPLETKWEIIKRECGAGIDLTELTTVTGRARRVAGFDEEVVLQAIRANRPDLVILNHVDYFDYAIHEKPNLTPQVACRVSELESRLGLKIDHVGSGPGCVIDRPVCGWHVEDAVRRQTKSRSVIGSTGSDTMTHKKWREHKYYKFDPFADKIQPALLNSVDIERYVGKGCLIGYCDVTTHPSF